MEPTTAQVLCIKCKKNPPNTEREEPYCDACLKVLRDSRDRRKRHRGRQPTGKRVKFKKDADIPGILAPLLRHGMLPSHYLYEFNRLLGGRVNRNELQKRLCDFYNEDNTSHRGPYLNRPADQFPPGEIQLQSIVYTLDHAGYRALGGKRHLYASRADAGWYEHQLMTACITASLELATLKHGTIFGSQEEIFRHKECPPATLEMERPIELQLGERTEFDKKTGQPKKVKTTIIPDQLFRIKYPSKNTVKIFVLEADRATEDLETVFEKIRRWVFVLKNEVHKTQWGAPSLLVMIYTTDEHRMRRFMGFAKAYVGKETWLLKHLLFQFDEQFEQDWHVPTILYDVYEKPYYLADGKTFDITY
jgi:hypothetical protein